MKQISDLDYVTLYAEKLKHNNRLFAQQKVLIESQMRASSSFFASMFGSKNYKENARKYLRSVGLL
ncbi:hypothetical protein HYX10_06345 [Candidatus Woesearchaeota archaeon]|nr:hypothetical protein [Candidatus Woesearchaeota archaeon]